MTSTPPIARGHQRLYRRSRSNLLQALDINSVAGQITDPATAWAYGSALLQGWPKKCVTDTLAKWRGQLGGVDVFVLANCSAMQNGLRAGDLP